ncbi:MAG: LacI family DNA-binding transcriptional regulator [Kineosporiaceae bacterium]
MTTPYDADPFRRFGYEAAPERRRPTMRDVAARAGVSLKTVSRVVNDEPGVSTALGERVRRAIDELDFRPNFGARNLRRSDGKTYSVGLLVEDVANPFSSALQRAVEDVALPRGVVVFSASVDEDPARERELARAFSTRRVDGLILAPIAEDQSYLETDLRAGTAIVTVDREPVGLDVDSVVSPNRDGAAEGVRHLVSVGHRRIAFLGERTAIATARQRHTGYLQALRAEGIAVDPALARHDLSDVALAEAAAVSLLDSPNPPTALFTAQNLVTIGALRALRRLGLEREVAVVGFDDFPLADLMNPGITVVAQDPGEMGRVAAGVLFRRLGGDRSASQVHTVPTTLVRRGSGEIAPRR